ncbi:MAG: PAS domain S-box protein [Candidatus Tectomicrobia bacterium]|nr:PAS domain S-box protein [Candidatus Tectomicrobia bacterium]
MDSTFRELRLNLILLIHASGRVVFESAFDLAKKEAAPVPKSHRDFFLKNPSLWRHPNPGSRADGIGLLPEGSALMFSSRPILTSDDKGPVRGAMIMARLLDAPAIARLAKRTQLSLAVRRYGDPQLPADYQAARASLPEGRRAHVRPLGEASIAGYAVLPDVFGKPALLLKVELPREIHAQGKATNLYFLLAFLALGVATCGAVLLLLERSILSRLSRLTAGVGRIRESADLSARVSIPGRDELSRLAGEISAMLEGVERSHRALHAAKAQLEGLVRASANISSILDLAGVLQAIFEESVKVLGADRGSVYLFDRAKETGQYLATRKLSKEFLEGLEAHWRELPRARVLSRGEPAILRDVVNDPSQAPIRDLNRREGIRSALIVPLRLRGEIIGAMSFYFDSPRDLADEQVSISQAFADQTAIAIENADLYARVRESEERFRSLVERAGDAVFLHDREGRFIDVNQQACESLGYSREELLGLRLPDVEMNFIPENLERLERQMEAGRSVTLEAVHRRKDGGTFPVEVRLGPVDLRGRRLFLALIRDVTERKRAQEMWVRNEKLAALGRLTAGAAHEILNPANIIGLHAQGLIGRPDDPKAVVKSGHTIYESVKRIARICSGLRRFSREEEPAITRFDLPETIRETVSMLEPQVRMADVTLSLEFPEEPLTLEADRNQISQVLVNLINNALDAMQAGGNIRLRAAGFQRDGAPWVRISVRDEGAGIPPETLPRIFDPFFTTKEMTQGTGLGLSIVHGIVEDHRGGIEVESEVGKGTAFHVELPAQSAARSDASRTST